MSKIGFSIHFPGEGMKSKAIAFLVRPYIWYELPMWGKIYELFVGGYKHDNVWSNQPKRLVRGKLHGFKWS
jgi:hypothetical protein